MGEIAIRCKIEIRSTITKGEEAQEDNHVVEGEYIEKGESCYLRYDDPSIEGSILLKWQKDRSALWVIRHGEIQVRQHFLPNEETDALYMTPYGTFPIRIFTHNINLSVRNGEGFISLRYALQVGEDNPADHNLLLRVERF